MGGTILNVITVALGSIIGLALGNRLPERFQTSIVTGLGLITFFVGIDNARQTGNVIIVLLSIVIGVIIGEALRLDDRLNSLAGWLQERFSGNNADDNSHAQRQKFITGFVTASLVFCVGPLTFLGSIQDGMGLPLGFQQLAIKSVLDAFAAMAFAASFGIGVLFTTLTVFIVQGGLALIGSLVGNIMTDPMIAEMTATGGIILMGLALILLDVKKPRMANFLPALLVAPLLIAIAQVLNIAIYPTF